MYFGVPEARANAIRQARELLRFYEKKNRPLVIVFVGPQKVGKSSAVLEIESAVLAEGSQLGKDFARVHDFGNIPDVPTLFFDEIPIDNIKLLGVISKLAGEGKRVVLDVMNNQHFQGDPRNVDEAMVVLKEIFCSVKTIIYGLYSVQAESAIPAIVNEGLTLAQVDFYSDPELKVILERHLRDLLEVVSRGVFVAGSTFVDGNMGVLKTQLVWNGNTHLGKGSPYGQWVTTTFRPELLRGKIL